MFNMLPTRRKSVTWLLLILTSSLLGFINITWAEDINQRQYFDIKPQHVSEALKVIAKQTEHQLLFSNELVGAKKNQRVKGNYTLQEALNMMLLDTNLVATVSKRGVIVITSASHTHTGEEEKMQNKKNWMAVVIGLFASSGTAHSANAQESEVKPDHAFEEIVVTSRKRSQSLQEVPQSVSVATGESLQQNVITDLQSLTDGSPTITVVRTPLNDSLYIRGVGSGENPGFQQSVGTFVDGIYRGRGPASRGAFFDVDRIEILRGPQPVYFGNSTIGGAFNIVSRGPGEVFEASVRSSYEFNADEFTTEIAFGGPLSNTLGMRVALLNTDSRGWMDDTVQNRRVPALDNQAARITLQYEPIDGYDATLKVEYSDNDEEGSPLQLIACDATVPQGPTCNPAVYNVPGFEDELNFKLSRGGVLPNGEEQTDTNSLNLLNVSLQQNYALSDSLTLTSVTGLVDYTNDKDIDADVGPSAFITAARDEEFEQFSQEFRLSYDGNSNLNYMLGVYYDSSDLYFAGDPVFGALGAPGSGLEFGARVNADFTQDQQNLGVFGSVGYDITDELTLTIGARWSRVETEAQHVQDVVTLDGDPASPFVVGAVRFGPLQMDVHALSDKRTDTDLNPSVELQYTPSKNVMLYGSYKEGFKTGGFDANIALALLAEPTELDPNGGFEFEAEEASAYEAGAKMQLMNNRLLLNVAAFRTEFENLQTSIYDFVTGTFITGNAAKSVSQGIEIDAKLQVGDYLRLILATTFLDSTFSEYDGARCNTAQNAAFTPSNPSERCTVSIDGQSTPYSPDVSGSLGYEFYYPLSERLELISSAQLNYTDSFFGQANPDLAMIQESFTKINARIGLSGNYGQWEVALYGKNLTNEVTFRQYRVQATGAEVASIDRGREIGLQFLYNFFW